MSEPTDTPNGQKNLTLPDLGVSGAKRANVNKSEVLEDWYVGSGKDTSCQFEGSWYDMVCFARNVLASKNTELVDKEYYKPEWKNDNY